MELKYRILNNLNENHQRKLVASVLKIPYSTLRDYLNEFEDQELIERVPNTNPIWYELTDTGRRELKRLSARFSEGGEDSQSTLGESDSQKIWILHHFALKYPIIKDFPLQHFNSEIDMNNWIKKIDEWKDCKVVKTTKHIIIHAKQLTGSDPFELEHFARNIADNMISIFEEHYGMEFGRPIQVGKPDYETNDPMCQQFSKRFTIKHNEGLSTVGLDASKFGGEISFNNPQDAKDYLEMPSRVKKLDRKVEKVQSDLTSLHEKVEILRANDQVIGKGIELLLETYHPQKKGNQGGIEFQ
jgi:DNA-binding MarR family transcriptional regulator